MKTTRNLNRMTGTLRNRILRLAAVACIALGALAPATSYAVAPSSGVPFLDALSDARHLASIKADMSVYMVKGDSMEPFFGNNSILVINKTDFDALRPGMMVVYRDAAGDFVAHRVIEHTSIGWTVMGQNNDKKDPGLVTSDNYQGTVFCMLHYKAGTDKLAANDTKPALALAKHY
jgi:signal peptidase I